MFLFRSSVNEEFNEEEVFMEMRRKFPQETDNTLRRFCVARNFNLENASNMLTKHLQWRQENLPVMYDSCAKEIDKEIFTHRGFDKCGRPIFLYHGSRNDPNTNETSQVIQAVIFALETAFAAADSNESDGKAIIIFYLNKGSQFDPNLIRCFANTMSDNYPERCFKALIFPGTQLAFTLWNLVKYFFDQRTREKVMIVPRELQGRCVFEDLIAEDQLQCIGIDSWEDWLTGV